MGKVEDIIRRYAEAKEPIEGFGAWLLADKDSAEKEEALSGLWDQLEAMPVADDAFLRRTKLSVLMRHIPIEKAVASSHRLVWMVSVSVAAALGLFLLLPKANEDRAIPTSDQAIAQITETVSEIPEGRQVGEILESTPVLALKSSFSPSVKIPVRTQLLSADLAGTGQSNPIAPLEEADSDWQKTYSLESEENSASGLTTEAPAVISSGDSEEEKAAVVAQWTELERRDRQEGQRKNRPLSVGLQSSGGLLASTSTRTVSLILGQDGAIIGNVYGTPYGAAPSTDQDIMTRYDIPFRTSVSFYAPLSDHLSVGGGLALTRLHSRSTSVLLGVQDTRYRYLGVPLMLRYYCISGSGGSLYSVVGVETDYCVEGRKLIHPVTGGIREESFDQHPIQFSTRFGAGYEYLLYHRWHLFAEVSIDYYFKDYSSLDTYFKQHHLTPSVTLGIQYVLSR